MPCQACFFPSGSLNLFQLTGKCGIVVGSTAFGLQKEDKNEKDPEADGVLPDGPGRAGLAMPGAGPENAFKGDRR